MNMRTRTQDVDEKEVKRIVDKHLAEEPSLIDNYLYPEKQILRKVYQDLVLKGKVAYRTRREILEHYNKDVVEISLKQ